jgi:hypothetical protein
MPDGRFQCGICKRFLANAKCAKQHASNVHGNPEYFECLLCKKIFGNRPNFRAHVSSHGIRGRDLVGSYGRAVNVPP